MTNIFIFAIVEVHEHSYLQKHNTYMLDFRSYNTYICYYN